MKFKEYVKFKDLKIGLVKQRSDMDTFVKKVENDFSLQSELVDLKLTLNKELNCFYRGKYLFDFCTEEDINIDDLRIKEEKRKKKIKYQWFKVLSELAKTKTNIEQKLSDADERT